MEATTTTKRKKKLSEKQQKALALLTSGKGMTYKAIAEEVGIDQKNLYRWRTSPDFAHFQQALQELNDERWLATVDAARASALQLCLDGNQKMVEFILKNDGLNPTQKVEAEINGTINIVIDDEEEG